MQQVVVVAETVAGLPAGDVAGLLVETWQARHPDAQVTGVAVSDGGAGLLDAVARTEDTWRVAEVAGPLGHPVEAAFLLRPDGSAVVEAARAAGPERAPDGVAPLSRATTYGVGQLLDAAREAGATRILVGVAGVAAIDGGAGALTGLGVRLSVEDGSGLKIGLDDLHRVASVEPGWCADWSDVEVCVLTDAPRPLAEAADGIPPGVRVDDGDLDRVANGIARWREVASRDLSAAPLALRPGSGAGGGLAFGLAAGLGATLEPAVDTIWALQDGPERFTDVARVLVAAHPDGAVHEFAARRAAGGAVDVHLLDPRELPAGAGADEVRAAAVAWVARLS